MLSPSSFAPDPYATAVPWKSLPPDLITASTSRPRRGISALLPTVCTRVPSIALKSIWLRSAAGAGGGGRQHPFEHLPRGAVLAVDPELHRVAQTGRADVQIRAHAGHLVQEGVEPIPRRGEHLQLLARELGRGGRRRRVHQRRGARDRNRLGHGTHVHLRVHSRGEPDGQPHAFATDVLKAGELEQDGVDADRQRRQAVLAPLVRDSW